MADDGRARLVQHLASCAEPLSSRYDVAMLDLDGVVYRGGAVIDGVVDALTTAVAGGMRLSYVTNNASRTPAQVVRRLQAMGVPAQDGDVVTSAQAAARLVRDAVPAGSDVLVVGGEGLRAAIEEYGLRCVSSAEDRPAAVVQGFSPDVDWTLLSEGAYAVADGAIWIASNTDLTIPTARGVAPGNGTLVHAIAAATGVTPRVAGKPETPLFDETVLRVGGRRPLVVGDRLDTDIEGANTVGADSLAVLTGVSSLEDLVTADPVRRPTFVGVDLAALNHPQADVLVSAAVAHVDGVTVRCDDDGTISSEGTGPGSSTALLRATLALAWARLDDGRDIDVSAVRRDLGRR